MENPQENNIVTCSNCGATSTEEMKYCRRCGAALLSNLDNLPTVALTEVLPIPATEGDLTTNPQARKIMVVIDKEGVTTEIFEYGVSSWYNKEKKRQLPVQRGAAEVTYSLDEIRELEIIQGESTFPFGLRIALVNGHTVEAKRTDNLALVVGKTEEGGDIQMNLSSVRKLYFKS